ncbi:hypothetical protein MBOVa_1060 [Mycoplasmopsis bovis 8790]|nr:hypothetical protein MBOVa_1060 [Mycoplasmopsis bovis 8790]
MEHLKVIVNYLFVNKDKIIMFILYFIWITNAFFLDYRWVFIKNALYRLITMHIISKITTQTNAYFYHLFVLIIRIYNFICSLFLLLFALKHSTKICISN